MNTLITLTVLVLLVPPVQDKTSTRPASRAWRERKREGGFLGIRFVERARQKEKDTVLEIESVLEGSCAEKAGFQKGDHITKVNGNRAHNGDQFLQRLWSGAMEGPRGTGSVAVLRNGKEVSLPVGLAELDAKPAVGDPAPDFTLASADGKTVHTLSKLIGKKPVVLIFGSFT